MSLNTILEVSESIAINDQKLVGQVLSRNQRISTSELLTVQPFEFTMNPMKYLLYSQNRDLLSSLRVADKATEQYLNFTNIGWLNYVAYQGDMTLGEIAACQWQTSSANKTLVLGSLPSISATDYIVKVGDRDNEQDGVKCWRFKHNYKQEGILDKIIPIWKAKGDITDPDNGRDLILELTKAKTPKGATYTVIQTVMYDDPAPISKDTDQMADWVGNEMTWEDVYSKKPVEYLEALARGETPRWDSEKGGYTYSNNETSEVSIGGTKSVSITEVADPQKNDEVDEDLPF